MEDPPVPIPSQELVALLRALGERIRRDEADRLTWPRDDPRSTMPEPNIDMRIPIATPIHRQRLQDGEPYRHSAWDNDLYEAVALLIHDTYSQHAYLQDNPLTHEEIRPAYVRYEYRGPHRGWRRSHARNRPTIQLERCEVYVLGIPYRTYRPVLNTMSSFLVNWNTLDRLLSNSWYLSRPIDSPAIPERQLEEFGGNHHAQLAQLTAYRNPIPESFLEVNVAVNHLNQHPSRVDDDLDTPVQHTPPRLSERVLVLDRSPGYTSVVLEELLRYCGFPPTRSLVDVFSSENRAYGLARLDPRFAGLLKILDVPIIVFADIHLRRTQSAEDTLRMAIKETGALQVLFLTREAMYGSGVEARAIFEQAAQPSFGTMDWDRIERDAETYRRYEASQMDSVPSYDSDNDAQDPHYAYRRARAGSYSSSVEDEEASTSPRVTVVRLPSPLPSESDSQLTQEIPAHLILRLEESSEEKEEKEEKDDDEIDYIEID